MAVARQEQSAELFQAEIGQIKTPAVRAILRRCFLMQEMGLEPTRISTADFESAASAIPPLLRVTLLFYHNRG